MGEEARQSLLCALRWLPIGDAFGELYVGPREPDRIASRALSPAPWMWTDDTSLAIGVAEAPLEDN